uniref:Uncharacterized protein n=1 Tax=Cacopsylla melanoneura TaxID=428564 RepID=A0A8D8QRE4_9HEMI
MGELCVNSMIPFEHINQILMKFGMHHTFKILTIVCFISSICFQKKKRAPSEKICVSKSSPKFAKLGAVIYGLFNRNITSSVTLSSKMRPPCMVWGSRFPFFIL